MSLAYRRLLRPVLFGSDPERAHQRALRLLGGAGLATLAPLLRRRRSGAVTVFGIDFGAPVGLAAGMDKDGVALRAWPALGFGFVEVGTVTAHAQPGNPAPRLFRLPASEAVINRMGFNNAGAAALAARLARYGPLPVPLGISIGKSKVTPLGEAVGDYLTSLRLVEPYADYVAINVSSPNTPGLRQLQDRKQLAQLLAALRGATDRPLLVKIAPDLTDAAIGELLGVCLEQRVDGIIAVNTTTGREGVLPADAATATQAGGLSGRPLAPRAREVVRLVHAETGGRLPVIGVGGISCADDAQRLVDAGARLVQLYTGLIYQGPGLVRAINRRLAGAGGQ